MIGSLRQTLKTGLIYLRGGRPLEWYVRRGLRVGANAKLEHPFFLDPSHCWLIDIGAEVTFSAGVIVLAHDASTKRDLGVTKVARVHIGDRVFVGWSAVILPGVNIGADSVIGAASVVAADIPAGSVAVGNPARVVASTDEYLGTQRRLLEAGPHFDERWTANGGISSKMKETMRSALEDGVGFVP